MVVYKNIKFDFVYTKSLLAKTNEAISSYLYSKKESKILVRLCLLLCETIAQHKPLKQARSGEIAHNRTTLAHAIAFLRTVFNLKFFNIFLRILEQSKNDLKEEKVKR